jgi:hypothetical protein
MIDELLFFAILETSVAVNTAFWITRIARGLAVLSPTTLPRLEDFRGVEATARCKFPAETAKTVRALPDGPAGAGAISISFA